MGAGSALLIFYDFPSLQILPRFSGRSLFDSGAGAARWGVAWRDFGRRGAIHFEAKGQDFEDKEAIGQGEEAFGQGEKTGQGYQAPTWTSPGKVLGPQGWTEQASHGSP